MAENKEVDLGIGNLKLDLIFFDNFHQSRSLCVGQVLTCDNLTNHTL